MECDPAYRVEYVKQLKETFCDFSFDETQNSLNIATEKLKF